MRFNRAFPEAMVTVPARRSIFAQPADLPVPQLEAEPGDRHEPRLAADRRPAEDVHHRVLKDNGYWTAQVSDNPFTRLHGGRSSRSGKTLPPLGDDRRPVGLPAGPAERADRRPSTTGSRPSCATSATCPACASTSPTRARACDEEETCAARVYKEASDLLDDARLRQPFCLRRRLLRPARAVEHRRRSTSTCTATRATRARRSASRRYGFARNFTPSSCAALHAVYAGRGHDDRPLARPLHGPLLRARARRRTRSSCCCRDHGYLLGERGYTGKVPSQLHPELAQVPFVIVHPDGRAAGEVSQHFASTHDVGPDAAVAGRASTRPRWMEGADLSPVLDGGQRADAEARLPLRRHVQPLLHPHRRLGPDRRQPRQGAHALRPAARTRTSSSTSSRRTPKVSEELYDRSWRRRAGRCRTTSRRSATAPSAIAAATPARSRHRAPHAPASAGHRSCRTTAARSAAITTLDSLTAATGPRRRRAGTRRAP